MRFKTINIYALSSGKHSPAMTQTVRNDSAHVSEMYERLLKYYDNEHCKQLNISCDTGAEEISLHPSADGFPEVRMPFQPAEYEKLTDAEKSRFWLGIIHSAVRCAADAWGWDTQVFERVEHAADGSGFVNCWKYGKAVRSPDGSLSGAVWVEQNIRSTRIFLVLQKGRTEVQRVLLQETAPPVYAYMPWLGAVEWEDVQNVLVRRKQDGKVLLRTLLTETETL